MQRYFCFNNKDEFLSILSFSDDSNSYKTQHTNYTIFEIGKIIVTPAVLDDNENVLVEAVFASGYYVNVLSWGSWDDTKWLPNEVPAPRTPFINWT